MKRAQLLLSVLIILGWLGMMVYIWLWKTVDEWTYVGTVNLTIWALLAFLMVWLGGRIIRRFVNRKARPS